MNDIAQIRLNPIQMPSSQNLRVGDEFDVWPGDFQDIDDEIERQDSV